MATIVAVISYHMASSGRRGYHGSLEKLHYRRMVYGGSSFVDGDGDGKVEVAGKRGAQHARGAEKCERGVHLLH